MAQQYNYGNAPQPYYGGGYAQNSYNAQNYGAQPNHYPNATQYNYGQPNTQPGPYNQTQYGQPPMQYGQAPVPHGVPPSGPQGQPSPYPPQNYNAQPVSYNANPAQHGYSKPNKFGNKMNKKPVKVKQGLTGTKYSRGPVQVKQGFTGTSVRVGGRKVGKVKQGGYLQMAKFMW